MNNHLIKITLNFLAVVLLIGLIVTPFLFAKNFSKVAGAKNTARFLIVSQIENFPNLSLSQNAQNYQIAFTKQSSAPQAFLDILLIANPTQTAQTYSLNVASSSARLFFGDDINNQPTTITIPSSVSVPISLYSSEESTAASQTVEFTVSTE